MKWLGVRRVLTALGAVAAVLLSSGCSGGGPVETDPRTTAAPPPPPPLVRFAATLLQYRPDEGTNRLEVELTNRTGSPVTVDSVQLVWSGLRGAPKTPKDTTYAVGQTIDLTTTYGAAACTGPEPTERPAAVVTIDDGRNVQLGLDGRGSAMLRRFRARDCALQRLAAAASVHFGPEFHPVRVHGQEYLGGTLVLRRPAEGDASLAVTVATLTGSVLLTFLPPPRSPLPVTLRAGQPRLTVPVLIGATSRCDDHSRSQSTQTFLLSVYLRLGDDHAQQRVIVVPEAEVRAQAQALMDRACHRGS